MKTAFLWAGALTLAMAGPVAADPGKNNAKGKGNAGQSTMQNDKKSSNASGRNSDVRNARYDRNDRNRSAGRLYALDARGNCPPGLTKKNNGCTPPGQAKKLYNVGQRYNQNFGSAWTYNQIPNDLRSQYGLNDDDRYYYNQGYLYQVDPKTMLIERAISALLR